MCHSSHGYVTLPLHDGSYQLFIIGNKNRTYGCKNSTFISSRRMRWRKRPDVKKLKKTSKCTIGTLSSLGISGMFNDTE
jgi:hypothetical protein